MSEPEVDKFYWVRFYRDTAEWEPAQLVRVLSYGAQVWYRIGSEEDWYQTEVNEVGPEIIPPQ